jgi:hypothetical protein
VSRNPKELTKAEVIARAEALDARRQDQIARQIDSINRLLGTQELDPPQRYEDEMLALNNAIIDLDRRGMVDRAKLRRLRSSMTDILDTTLLSPRDRERIKGWLEIITEGETDARPNLVGTPPDAGTSEAETAG